MNKEVIGEIGETGVEKPLFVKTIEEIIDDEFESNKRLEDMSVKENRRRAVGNTHPFKKVKEFTTEMSSEILTAFEELVEKPNDMSVIFFKNNRMTYIGIIIMFISILYNFL
jgi:hypothetical protein